MFKVNCILESFLVVMVGEFTEIGYNLLGSFYFKMKSRKFPLHKNEYYNYGF